MFPLRDENPTLQTSVITIAIIVVNILVWFFIQGFGTQPLLSISICKYGLIAGEFLHRIPDNTQIHLGQGILCVTRSDGSWISLFTHMFMHGGWFHLIGNMWFLAIFGDNVEDSMGRIRFIIFYLLCGISAAVTQMLFDPTSLTPMVGASGAIGGVMGAYAVLYPRAPVHMLVFLGFYIDRIIVPAYFMLGYWFLLQIISALPMIGGHSAGVAFWAHVGGFVTGIILVLILKDRQRIEMHHEIIFKRWGRW